MSYFLNKQAWDINLIQKQKLNESSDDSSSSDSSDSSD